MLGSTYVYTRNNLAGTNERYPPEFVRDLESRLWFTYRTGFPPIHPTNYKSDAGWGCMLRSAQMLLGQALVVSRLGREWRRDSSTSHARKIYAEIVDLFMDEPGSSAPFSLHRLCTQGKRLGKGIGEWFGPATASQVLK
ncbi:hypothetical protein K493DRAFT_227257 [Basidiobolus meristosporus CBS 931.73]|uniref:Cysteine protease n=1 Tax=Basidiobolus meristosporus CBS 931.73 TaxID=1314790 RepID=A0A1Y1Y1A1_9FUNG|nr:hypothetical protein K493DRAFT_227257 [Basidiobolus meristosporus CBS 931.73]|eukprot:ORX91783.1 hypothetical protein K493DRAFT_227257 [Basidiobolus meristosporus CBS 931.73]